MWFTVVADPNCNSLLILKNPSLLEKYLAVYLVQVNTLEMLMNSVRLLNTEAILPLWGYFTFICSDDLNCI